MTGSKTVTLSLRSFSGPAFFNPDEVISVIISSKEEIKFASMYAAWYKAQQPDLTLPGAGQEKTGNIS